MTTSSFRMSCAAILASYSRDNGCISQKYLFIATFVLDIITSTQAECILELIS